MNKIVINVELNCGDITASHSQISPSLRSVHKTNYLVVKTKNYKAKN